MIKTQSASLLTRPYLSHKKYRALQKKLKRKRWRQAIARLRNAAEKDVQRKAQLSPGWKLRQAELEAEEILQDEANERERARLHKLWLERELKAQEEFHKQKEAEAVQRAIREEQQRKIKEEWELQQRMEKEKEEEMKSKAEEKREREEEGPWHNPIAPPDYGTEKDRANCPFFLKTGACRFGDRCSRQHLHPNVSCTILIRGMYSHFSLEQSLRDEYDSDISLEYDDKECYQHFREFYDDVLPEFKKIGRVVQFKVCCNYEPHLRGNVYVQFKNEDQALEALKSFNGRFYAGKQLSCELTAVSKWKSAICGLYNRNKCPKGKNCNFLHVFKNPSYEFASADYDLSSSPRHSEHRNSSRRDSSSYSSRSVSKSPREKDLTSSYKRRSRSSSRRSCRHHSSSSSRRSSSRKSHEKCSPRKAKETVHSINEECSLANSQQGEDTMKNGESDAVVKITPQEQTVTSIEEKVDQEGSRHKSHSKKSKRHRHKHKYEKNH